MDFTNISLGLSFLAGLASFLSPCVFSLVPAYVGYLGGRAAGGEISEGGNRWITFTHGLAFVLGFSLVFILLGVATSAFGSLLYDLRFILAKVGGVVVVIFGLHMIGVFRIPFLEYDTRVQELPDPKWGYLSSGLLGRILLGWLVALCWPGAWRYPDAGPERWLDFKWRIVAHSLFSRVGDSFPDRCLGRWLGNNYSA